jgi:AraC family transcriptional regulator
LDERFLMSPVTREHLAHINRGDGLRPALEERTAFLLAGVMSLVQNDRQLVPHLWDILLAELARVEGMHASRTFYGLTWYPDDWEVRGTLYMASVMVDSPDVAGSALVTKRIPPARYARFTHKGRRAELSLTRDYIYQTWLPKSGENLACPLELECYGQQAGAGDGRASEWAILVPVRRMV